MKLLTIQQTAEQLTVNERTVRRLIGSGRLVAVRIGRSVRIDEGDLRSFVESARKPSLRLVQPPPADDILDDEELDRIAASHGF